jgi:hypothetical protein
MRPNESQLGTMGEIEIIRLRQMENGLNLGPCGSLIIILQGESGLASDAHYRHVDLGLLPRSTAFLEVTHELGQQAPLDSPFRTSGRLSFLGVRPRGRLLTTAPVEGMAAIQVVA